MDKYLNMPMVSTWKLNQKAQERVMWIQLLVLANLAIYFVVATTL